MQEIHDSEIIKEYEKRERLVARVLELERETQLLQNKIEE